MTLQDFSIPAVDPTQPQSAQQFAYQQEMARQLMQEGMSSAPIRSPWQGFANLGKALLGGYEMGQLRGQQRNMLASAIADNGNQLGLDPGQQDIPATPGFTSAALRQSDSINDEVSNGEDAGLNHAQALAKALAGAGGASPPQSNAALAAALGGAPPQQGNAPLAAALGAVSPSAVPSGPANNPGNLVDNSWTHTLPGYAGPSGRFASFATPEAGAAAMARNLASYAGQGVTTLNQLTAKWAPSGDGANDPAAYAATLARGLGIDPNAPINLSDPSVQQRLIPLMARVEQGSGAPPVAAPGGPVARAADGSPVQTNAQGMAIDPNTGRPVAMLPPSPAAVSQLSAAMQPPARPSTSFGLISPAEAAPATPQMDPRLAGAASLSAPPPAGAAAGAAPVNPYVDHLSAAAAASPLAQGGNISGPAMPGAGSPGAMPLRPAALPAPGAPMQLAGAAPSLDVSTAPGLPPASGASSAAAPMPAATPPAAPPMAQFGIHPDLNAAARILSNPWATPAQQQIAIELLKNQMPTPPSIVEGPVDPQTGYPSRLLFSPTRGIMGRLNTDGSVTPVGAGGAPPPATPANGAAIPPPPPGVDPKKWREEMATRTAQDASPTATNELEFAQKLTDRQSYKEFTQALPTWNAFTQHVQDDTPAADKAIIDDFAKILNPGRAVTTGAFILNLDAQSIPAELKATISKWAVGEGELGPDARAQMARVAQEKMTQYKSAWDADSTQATKVAQAHGLAVDRVIPQTPDVAPLDLGKVNSTKTMAGAPKPASVASAPPAAVIGAMRADPQGTLAQARATIAARPDLRGAVIQRLQAAGIDPAGL